jgi:phage gp29-like protein
MNLITLVADIRSALSAPVTSRSPRPSPRAEPPNYASTAKASDLQSAIRTAEAGDPQNLFRLYRDSLMSDDHIQGCVNTRKLAVLGQPLAIMPKNRSNPDDTAAAAACNRAVADCENWKNALAALLDSHCIYPVVAAEKIFRPADAPDEGEPRLQYTLRRIEPLDPFLLCWKWAYQAGVKIDLETFEPLLKLWPIDPAQGTILRDPTKCSPLEAIRHITHRGHLLTAKDNWGGPGRAILGWWLLRTLGRDWFARFMERYGNPFPVGKTDKTDTQAVAFLSEAFALSTKIGGLVIDREDEVQLVQATVQGGAEGHKLWHDVCNNAISRHLTGIEASANPAGLNAGASNKAENVREDVRMFDQLMLVETLEKQLFAQFLRINGLTGKIKVSFGGLSDQDATQFATTLDTLGRAGLEIDDASLPLANERLGFLIRRKALAPAPSFGFPNPQSAIRNPQSGDAANPQSAIRNPQSEEEPELETFAVRDLHGKLRYFSAGSDRELSQLASPPTPRSDGVNALASAESPTVAAAMRESFAPLLTILNASSSPKDFEKQAAAFFADWRPTQFVKALEKPLQIAAAKGAADTLDVRR